MLAVCTVFSVFFAFRFLFLPLEEVKRVGSRIALGLFFSKKGGALEAAYFWSMNTPSVCQETPFYWLEMVTMSALSTVCFITGGTDGTLQLHISCNDEDLGVVLLLPKTSISTTSTTKGGRL